MSVRYHESLEIVQAMFGERHANAACKGVSAPTARAPFHSAEWFRLFENAGHEPFVASTKLPDGTAAAMVLERKSRRLEAMRNWYSFTWRAFEHGKCSDGAALEALATDLKSRTHRVILAPVPDEDGSASRLAAAFASAGWRVEVSQCDTNHILPVEGRSFAQYWAKRPGPLRTTFERRKKHLDCHIYERFDADAWRSYEQIYAQSWKPAEGAPAMLRSFAQSEAAAGRLRLGLGFHRGEPIAAQFWSIDESSGYIHKLAHLQSHDHLSPGTVLSATLFKHAIDETCVKMIDFGTGNERYKRDWMEATRPRYQIDCLDLRSPRAWIDLARLALTRTLAPDVPALASQPWPS